MQYKDFFLLVIIIDEIDEITESKYKEKFEKSINNKFKYNIIISKEYNNKLIDEIDKIKLKYKEYFIYKLFFIENNKTNKIEKINSEDTEYIFYDITLIINPNSINNKYEVNIQKIIQYYFKKFYKENKKKYKETQVLNSSNILDKILYDLSKLGININIEDNIKNTIMNIIKYSEEDNGMYNISNNYFNDLVSMIKKLFYISNIEEKNYYNFENFKNYFMEKMKILIENLKCKYFYYYFWCITISNHISEYLLEKN